MPHLLKSFFRVITVTLLFTTFFYQSWSQSPTAPAQGFNVFLLGDATPINNETEGPVALGGNLVLAGSYQVSTNHPGSYTVGGVTVTLLVGGKVIYQSGNGISVNQNGYVKIGDCTGSTIWYTDQNNAYSPIRITPGADYNGSPRISLQANSQQLGVSAVNNPVCQGGLIDFAAAFSQMQVSSTGMSSCSDNANLTNANGNAIPHSGLPNQVKINLNSGINILNLAGADMNLVQDFTYNNQPDANHVLVINVNAPGTFNWSVWNSGGIGGQNSPYILYNFYNTTTLNIQGNGAVEGTVFSPFADIVKTANQANIEGQIIAKSYYQNGGENHYFPFTTTVPLCNSTPALSCSAAASHAISCYAGNNGAATVTPTGGTGPYYYLWSNNQTTQTATGLTTGTYNVTVTDDHGATTTCSVTITGPSALNATGVKVDEASALGSDG
ncbi:MAG TPA: choice-of-anchor A family protein, partial [Chitinophagales bacterium]|nr:choice-of-anchor A family protein [Chitinophagales bacterium]